ncbi:hypothetical protein FACS1894140_1120 [Spirochaetia bacterium]|nr:hypothetical protein FACS1894140_1120 [Spirochaetia bacterium]
MVLALGVAFVGCGGKKKEVEPKSFTEKLESGLNTLTETAEKYSDVADTDRGALAMSLDIMEFKDLKPQIMGEVTPKIKKSDYPLQKSSSSYAIFGLKTLGMKAGDSIKASFNYTITSVEMDKCTIGVEYTDFKSDSGSESGPLSVYYSGDSKAFGANGPTVGQQFLGYVTYHASTIKVGIALPIIVVDGIELK